MMINDNEALTGNFVDANLSKRASLSLYFELFATKLTIKSSQNNR